MKSTPGKTWFKISIRLFLSLILSYLLVNGYATASNSIKLTTDSSIVYYSYASGEIKITFISETDKDTASIKKPDILIVGEIVDFTDLSQTTHDTLDDNWFKQTNYINYSYKVKVNDVMHGLCTSNFLELTVTSRLSNRFTTRFSHISENGDSMFEGTYIPDFQYGHSINKKIPVGEVCIFHFKKGELRLVDYIASYDRKDLTDYMKKLGLEKVR